MSDLDLLNQFWIATEKENHLGMYTGLVRRARPYTLDKDATELITELSSGETIQDKLAIYRRLARLPFDVIWIEFKYEDRLNERRRLGTVPETESFDDTPQKMGFLIQKLTDTQWRCLTICEFQPGQTQSGRTCDTFGAVHVVATQGPVDFRTWTRDPVVQAVVKDANARNYGMFSWGFGVRQDGIDYDTLPDHLTQASAVDLAPSYEHIIVKTTETASERKTKTEALFMDSIRELKGDLRFVVAALALINEAPIEVASTPRTGLARVGGRLKPYLVNRLVKIAIPKKRGRVRKIMSMLRLAERAMRRHEVSGHWKNVAKKGGVKELKWVNDYERGDGSLGWVHQVREVVKS